jgi:hypothetical protein
MKDISLIVDFPLSIWANLRKYSHMSKTATKTVSIAPTLNALLALSALLLLSYL